jgi:hypothetical protein
LIWRSSLRASLLVISGLTPAISTGIRYFVYFAPFPELWATNRLQLEVRIKALEVRLDDYTKELRDALKFLLQKECSRNDKLLMAYTQLKIKYDALKEELTHPDRPSAGAQENGTTIKPLQREKRFTLVSDSENQYQQW